MSNNNQLVKFKLPCKDWMWDVTVMCSEFTMVVGFILYVVLLTLHFCRGLDEFLTISIEFIAHAFSVFVFMRLYVHKQCKVYKVVGREYNEYSNLLSLIVYSIAPYEAPIEQNQ